jgi:3-hydroxyacyl-CoA dehydrogenase
MGIEIALQCAIGGFDVIQYDVSDSQLESAALWQRTHLDQFVRDGWLTAAEAASVQGRITATTDPMVAANVDLVSESVPEVLRLKRQVFAQFHQICPAHTIFTTNTSYLRLNQLVGHVGRPERFAALHFHPPVWKSNVVDVMPHDGTDPAVVETLRQFAVRIGQIPIVCRQQGEGFIFNSMLRYWLLQAITLADSGICTFEDIDRSWMGVMQSKVGPFGILDNIGLDTVSDILNFWSVMLRDEKAKRAAAFLKPFVEQGRLGIKSQRGFYDYPDPAYLREEFLATTSGPNTPEQALVRRFIKAAHTETTALGNDAHADQPQRFVLRAAPQVLHQKLKHPLQLHGTCLIIGAGPDAEALQARLEAQGARVLCPALTGTLAEMLARVDDLWQADLYPHLFLMTVREPAAATIDDAAQWQQRFERGVLLPYFVCQRWFAEMTRRNALEQASVVAATALGGDFGITTSIETVEGGGLAGLLKAIYLEGALRSSLGPHVKVVDAPLSQSPAVTAEQLCRELALAQASVVNGSRDESRRRYVEIEVGYKRASRQQLFLEAAPLTDAMVAPPIAPQEVWVITGGARGITAFVAQRLAQRFGVRLHLLGTTPLPRAGEAMDDRAQQVNDTLQALAAAGITARYHCCDVANREQLAATLTVIRETDGPIAGVLHGAGYERGAKFADKVSADVLKTLAVKASGMAHLMELTRDDPLRCFIAFGSLSGRFGNLAQTDYAMANELLGKQLVWMKQRRPQCHAVVFHWPAWEAIGMAARPQEREALRRGRHVFLSPEQGWKLLLDELSHDAPTAEVVVVHPSEVPLEMRRAAGATRSAPTWQG